ncbi:kinase-like domain-containing protein [Pilobolus umbonatus]|nr:kinase-like domain-containing protein [Pilobolus umbonatus]
MWQGLSSLHKNGIHVIHFLLPFLFHFLIYQSHMDVCSGALNGFSYSWDSSTNEMTFRYLDGTSKTYPHGTDENKVIEDVSKGTGGCSVANDVIFIYNNIEGKVIFIDMTSYSPIPSPNHKSHPTEKVPNIPYFQTIELNITASYVSADPKHENLIYYENKEGQFLKNKFLDNIPQKVTLYDMKLYYINSTQIGYFPADDESRNIDMMGKKLVDYFGVNATIMCIYNDTVIYTNGSSLWSLSPNSTTSQISSANHTINWRDYGVYEYNHKLIASNKHNLINLLTLDSPTPSPPPSPSKAWIAAPVVGFIAILALIIFLIYRRKDKTENSNFKLIKHKPSAPKKIIDVNCSSTITTLEGNKTLADINRESWTLYPSKRLDNYYVCEDTLDGRPVLLHFLHRQHRDQFECILMSLGKIRDQSDSIVKLIDSYVFTQEQEHPYKLITSFYKTTDSLIELYGTKETESLSKMTGVAFIVRSIHSILKSVRDLHYLDLVHGRLSTRSFYAPKGFPTTDWVLSDFDECHKHNTHDRNRSNRDVFESDPFGEDDRMSKSSDIWSLGVVLYTIISEGVSAEIFRARLATDGIEKTIDMAINKKHEYTSEFRDILSNTLQVNPKKRRSADKLLSDWEKQFELYP